MRKRFYIGVGIVAILATVFTPAITQRLILLRDFHPSVLLAFRDTVGTVVSDSLTALSADGVTIINDGVFKQRVVNDTTFLDAIKADSAGTEINLKQLSSSNTNGGGTLVYKSSGYTVDMKVVFKALTGYWVRREYLDNNYIDPRWCGLKTDGVTDNSTVMEAALTLAKTTSRILKLPGGVIVCQSAEIGLGLNEALVIEGVGAGRGGTGKTIIKGKLKLYKTSSQAAQVEISNVAFFRDTTSVARSDTGLVLDYITNSILRNVSAVGYNYGIVGIQCGQLKMINPALAYNKVGFKQYEHADGLHISGGFIAQQDSIGISSNFSYGSVIVGTEMSHQPVSLELVALAEWNIFGGRYEAADSTQYLINSGCILNVYGSSFLPGAGDGLIAQLFGSDSYLHLYEPVIDSDYNNYTYNIYTQAYSFGRVTAKYTQKSTAGIPAPKVFDDLTNTIFVPTIFETTIGGSPSIALAASTNWIDAGKILHVAKRNSASYGPAALVFYQEVNDSTYFTNVFTDNNDRRYLRGEDSTGTRVDRIREREYYGTVTLAASGNFTRDTLYVDKFISNTDYGFRITPIFNTDSLITAKIYSRSFGTGQVIVTFYHKGVNSLSGAYYLTTSYQANRWDYP